MHLLEERILADGCALSDGVLKVDGFINHQIDADLMYEIAKEFKKRFADITYNKILTIEASGIAPAVMLGYCMHLPVIFAKKQTPKTMDNVISVKIHSFTKNKDYDVLLSKSFLNKNDKVLFIDDFLAYGSAALGIKNLVEMAGAELVGMGFIIEKKFQNGGSILKEKGIRVESLAVIEEISAGKVKFSK